MHQVEAKLNLYFALMSCLCGLTFLGVPDLGALPFFAIFFALFGLFFVDLLRWFALPPMMAYVALGAIAFYTINRFITIGPITPEPQMIAVAELLVLVQAVLMLQIKSRRIYEQLAVFALLELIVAAIFNNALTYGLVLFPLGVIVVGALSLLHVYTTSEGAFTVRELAGSGALRVSSPESQQSFVMIAGTLPRLGMLTIAPAVLVVAMIFFYALPRTNQQSQRGLGGKAQVGFSSQVQLGQIGMMMLNPEIAARIELNRQRTGIRYDVIDGFYLRGTVLETYKSRGEPKGTWQVFEADRLMDSRALPARPIVGRASEQLLNDEVTVKIQVSPMSGDSLFSLPPYYFDSSGPDVVHFSDRWLISRRKKTIMNRESQIAYRFATHGFRNGVQSLFVPRFSSSERIEGTVHEPETEIERDQQASLARDREQSAANYVNACLVYDIDAVPSAERLAKSIVAKIRDGRNSPIEIARAMENHFANGQDFRYTLDLSMNSIPGLDPIEQFLSVDRRGNCQYFASALALMLRSQGIPARLVVGFNTDEFNNIGGFYVARQLHAHAWVEALIDAQWLKPNDLYYVRSPPQQYWMRLDPTPGGGGTNRFAGGGVSNVLELAQDIWTSYVVEADAGDRRRKLGTGNEGMSGTYEMQYEWLKLKISRIRAGELGAGALAGRDLFSWPSALIGIVLSLACVGAYRFGFPGWLMGSDGLNGQPPELARPSVAFFAEAVSMLERLGVQRRNCQTAKEYTSQAAIELNRHDSASLAEPLAELTSAFYLERFGKLGIDNGLGLLQPDKQTIDLALARIRTRVDEQTKSAIE